MVTIMTFPFVFLCARTREIHASIGETGRKPASVNLAIFGALAQG